jgi:hypothetical protein
VELLLIVGGLSLLALAASRYGQDSRALGEAGPWHTWRDLARRGQAGAVAPAIPDPLGISLAVTLRADELRAEAARERLLRGPSPARRPAATVGRHRLAAARVGSALVRVGERLQSYGSAAAPGW